MRSGVEIGASVPAFLGKLWKLVNDTETNHLISWTTGGKTFCIKNQADFARELLPLYYKHNNMASFIRQLNMYGFHKITSVENGGLRYEKDEIEFSHPCFMRGHSYLLEHIKRKIANPKSIVASTENGEKILFKPELMSKVLSDVKQMKGKQENLDAKFSAMKQENEALWREVAILRQKHIKQQQIVNNLIQFLISVVQTPRQGSGANTSMGVKRPFQLMINSAAHNSESEQEYPGRAKTLKLNKDLPLLEDLNEDNMEDGPTIHELAHDDLLHAEASPEALSPSNFITIEIPTTNVFTSQSSKNTASQTQYHVTSEDGEELDANIAAQGYPGCQIVSTNENVTSPVVTSPVTTIPVSPIDTSLLECTPTIKIAPSTSKSKTKGNISKTNRGFPSPSSFNSMSTSADLKLPADIFASDDSASDAGLLTSEEIPLQILQDSSYGDNITPIATTQDKMVGGINIKVEKPPELEKSRHSKKSKNSKSKVSLNLQNIKTELQDDLDWNNMTLATVNNNSDINRFQSMSRRDYYNLNHEEISSLIGVDKGDIDDHLDTMQTDLDSLRELFRTDSYSFDANTLMGLFGTDDPLYGLSYNPVDDRTKSSNNAKKQKGEPLNLSRDDNRADLCSDEDDSEAANQLISYTGNIPDFDDINLPDLEGDNSQDNCLSPPTNERQYILNTPQMLLKSPAYPQKP